MGNPKFQQRHYEALAELVNDMTSDEMLDKATLANALAELFEQDNPRFKRALFMRASGVADKG